MHSVLISEIGRLSSHVEHRCREYSHTSICMVQKKGKFSSFSVPCPDDKQCISVGLNDKCDGKTNV